MLWQLLAKTETQTMSPRRFAAGVARVTQHTSGRTSSQAYNQAASAAVTYLLCTARPSSQVITDTHKASQYTVQNCVPARHTKLLYHQAALSCTTLSGEHCTQAAAADDSSIMQVFDEAAQVLLYHLLNFGIPMADADNSSRQQEAGMC